MTSRISHTTRVAAVALGIALLGAPCLHAQDAEVPRTRTLPGLEDPAFPYAQPEEVGLSPEELTALGDSIAAWVGDDLLVGAEFLLIKDGAAVFHESYGWSDREGAQPMQRGSIFRLRSMTKPILGTAVLLLVEEGLLSLDDTAAKFLPSFDREDTRSITIRELLTHTSGLYGNDEDSGLAKGRREYATLRALVDAIGEAGAARPSGTYAYSDDGSATLGAIVAEVSGVPVERFIETRILVPLGMNDTHTRFTPDAPWADRMNSTYRRADDGPGFVRYWDPTMEQSYPYFRASGGIYSTTMDYARFMSMWMSKGRIGNGALLTEETAESALTIPESTLDSRHRYGMHWQIMDPAPVNGLPALFGHGGSDGTLAVARTDQGAIALFFTQSRGNEVRQRFAPQLGFVLNRQRALDLTQNASENGSDPAQAGAGVLAPEDIRAYAGTYRQRGEGLTLEFSEQDGQLFVQAPGQPTPRPLTTLAADRFFFRDFGFDVTFVRGDGGAVAGVEVVSPGGDIQRLDRIGP